MNSKLLINNNAKKDELKAYIILKDIFFDGKMTYVGDNPGSYLPDIYTDDHSVGVEVTSCEHISQFILENKKRIRKKEVENYIDCYDKMTLKDKNIYFNNEFENVLEKKIKKISNYRNCKSINLIIMSDNDHKDFIRRESLAKIYHKLIDKYKSKYDNLFLYYNDCLYVEINYQFLKIKKIKDEIFEM